MNLDEIKINDVDLSLAKKLLEVSPPSSFIKSDLLFVFGCPGSRQRSARVKKAYELYKKGFGKKVIFTGGKRKEIIEAHEMLKEAIQLGIAKEDILIETNSYNTTENIIASLLVIEKNIHLCNVKNIIFITDEAHLKRCLLTAKKYLPSFITFQGVKTDFTLNQEKEEHIISEAKKLITYAKLGYISSKL